MLLAQMMRKQLSIPKILAVSQVSRVDAQIFLQLRPSLFIQLLRAARALLFAQTTKAAGFETMHPTLNGRGMFSEQIRHFIATLSLANQKHSMQSMIVARFIRAVNLLLEGYFHRSGVGNRERFHGRRLATAPGNAIALCCIT
jgi:hypothetical protein